MKRLSLCWLFALMALPLIGAEKVFNTMFLYPDGAPDSNGITEAEYANERNCVYNTTNPRFDLYLPAGKTNVPCILVTPGGGYGYSSCQNEGEFVADFFVPHGIAIAVLKYRMPNGHEDIPLEDAARAMQLLRDNASVWGLCAEKIGVMGFSAGGHLAASLLTKYPCEKSRPSFGVLIYPVISMDAAITHKGTCRHLLGKEPTEEQRKNWSTELCVTEQTPATFIVACQDDKSVPVENSLRFFQACTAKHVPAEMLILPIGGHGFGFQRTIPDVAVFHQALITWLQRQ